MEIYNAKTIAYDVFSANMTMDTNGVAYRGSELSACKSCQCNCRLCLGGKAPDKAEAFARVDAENALVELLAA